MGDDSDEQLEQRVKQLEQQLSKMLPGRRGVLKGLGAAALGGAAVGGATGGAAGQSAAGQVGTESNPVDVEGAHGGFDSVSTDDATINESDLNLGANSATTDGNQTTAIGANADASGSGFNTALGKGATATATYTTAVGAEATADLQNGTAVGYQAKAINSGTGDGDGTAVGQNAIADGDDTTAIGHSANATDNITAAHGKGAKATVLKACALGPSTNAEDERALVAGTDAEAGTTGKAAGAVALGYNSAVNGGDRGLALGEGAASTHTDGGVIGPFGSSPADLGLRLSYDQVVMGCVGGTIDDSAMNNGEMIMQKDEPTNELQIFVKYADGTLKKGTVSLS